VYHRGRKEESKSPERVAKHISGPETKGGTAPMARNPIIRETTPQVPATTDETPHGCYRGWVFLGFQGEDDNGEPAEIIERVPCRRCRTDAEHF
jgi:hypothetical protein